MIKTETIHMRVDADLKKNAEKLLKGLGLSITESMNIFLHQIILQGGLPFEVKYKKYEYKKYNYCTENAMNEVKSNDKNSKIYSNSDELFKDLENEI